MIALLIGVVLAGTAAGPEAAGGAAKQAAARPTAEQVAAKAIAARGGLARLRAVRSQRMRGRISFGPGAEGPFTVEMKRPGQLREEVQLPQGAFIRTTDGKRGWLLNQGAGMAEARPLGEKELRDVAGSADFDGPLLDAAAKGNRLELLGREPVEGRDAWKLRVVSKDGRERIDWIDCESFLAVKWQGKLGPEGKEQVFETRFSDWREVAGVRVAHLMLSGSPGAQGTQRIQFDAVELDAAIDDARFGKPVAPAPQPTTAPSGAAPPGR